MKIGEIEIKKAYLGLTLLTNTNAFLGLLNMIKNSEPIIIATDSSNPELMKCARDNGWVEPTVTFMTDRDARKVETLLEKGDVDQLVFGIESEVFPITINDFYKIKNPDNIDRTDSIEIEDIDRYLSKVEVESIDLSKGILDNDGVTLTNGTTLRWWDMAVCIDFSPYGEVEHIYVPCVINYYMGQYTNCIKILSVKLGYYFYLFYIYITLNDFYQINDPDNILEIREFSDRLTDDMITKIDVASIDVTKGIREDGGVTLTNGTTLRWWDVACKNEMYLGNEALPCVFLKDPNTGEYVEEMVVHEGYVLPSSLLLNYEIEDFNAFKYFTKINEVAGLQINLRSMFPNSLEKISFPISLTSIGAWAFIYCENLKDVYLSNRILSIDYDAFYGCTSLESIYIPDSVINIGGDAFLECSSLKMVRLPYELKRIESYTFHGCSSLETIEIPDEVEYIEYSAFGYCSSLKSIIIPDSVTDIGGYIFEYCTSLEYVKIGAGVKQIGWEPFGYNSCPNLTELHYNNTIKAWKNIEFENNNWLDNTNIKVIHCTDGDIDLSAAILTLEDGTEVSIRSQSYITQEDISIYRDSLVSVKCTEFANGISSYAFSNCKKLSSIQFSDTINYIDYSAFENCISLESIDIPENITHIQSNTFYGCSSLESIKLPETIAGIGSYAFYDCVSLRELVLPANLENLDYGIFYNCPNLTELYYNNTIEAWNNIANNDNWCDGANIDVIHCTDGDIRLESAILFLEDGSEILLSCKKTISQNDIEPYRNTLVKVELKEFTAHVGYYAFGNCTKLESIKLSDSLIDINSSAFAYCTSLTEITIPANVETILYEAFYGCTNLSDVTFVTNKIRELGSYCFSRCPSLPIEDGITYAGECVVSIYTNTQEAIIKDSTKYICKEALQNGYYLLSLIIPASVIFIETNIFNYGAQNVEIIKVDESNVVYDSRENCNAIIKTSTNTLITGCKTTTIPNSVTSIGQYAFYNRDNLERISIPEGVLTIESHAFRNCHNLQRIDFPYSLLTIDYYAFEYCDSLLALNIPANVNYIHNDAFNYCYNISEITVNTDNQTYDSRESCNAIIETETNTIIAGCKNTIIHNGITSIGYDAFYGCNLLESINIPDSIEIIGSDAFYHCAQLSVIDLENTNIRQISYGAFSYCNLLLDINLPETLEILQGSAFYFCENLTTITIPAATTQIDGYLFGGCTNLLSIKVDEYNPKYDSRDECNAVIETETNTLISACDYSIIPNTVEIIAYNAFGNCRKMRTINIPDSVKEIRNWAFEYCYALEEVIISENIEKIDYDAFYGCTSLTSITCKAVYPPTISYDAFLGTNNCPIYVPENSVDLYKSTANWSNYRDRIQPIPSE